MKVTKGQTIQGFVSYSHEDHHWLKRFQVHIKPLVLNGQVEFWDDTRIRAGDQWAEEIDKALTNCEVAVLFVSADFLASDFIQSRELPELLAGAEERGTRIVPVIVGHCLYDQSPLAGFQSFNSPEQPLQDLDHSEQEKSLRNLAVLVGVDSQQTPEEASARIEQPENHESVESARAARLLQAPFLPPLRPNSNRSESSSKFAWLLLLLLCWVLLYWWLNPHDPPNPPCAEKLDHAIKAMEAEGQAFDEYLGSNAGRSEWALQKIRTNSLDVIGKLQQLEMCEHLSLKNELVRLTYIGYGSLLHEWTGLYSKSGKFGHYPDPVQPGLATERLKAAESFLSKHLPCAGELRGEALNECHVLEGYVEDTRPDQPYRPWLNELTGDSLAIRALAYHSNSDDPNAQTYAELAFAHFRQVDEYDTEYFDRNQTYAYSPWLREFCEVFGAPGQTRLCTH